MRVDSSELDSLPKVAEFGFDGARKASGCLTRVAKSGGMLAVNRPLLPQIATASMAATMEAANRSLPLKRLSRNSSERSFRPIRCSKLSETS